jgi:dolichol-phosphate mannosyltransferase
MEDKLERALVVVPTYNERENLTRLIPSSSVRTLGSTSSSSTTPPRTAPASVADRLAADEPRLHVLHREGKLGLGTAYIAGFRWALERDYDAVFEMDADFSHDPEHLPQFLAALREFDVVLGSRYLHGRVTVVNWPMPRLFLSYAPTSTPAG